MHLFGHSDSSRHHGHYSHVRNVIRVVVMGAAGVGKTALIKQCLYHEYTSAYKETIEDEFHYKGDHFELDILDTSGSYNFPDMNKLAIQAGDIFVLVFSVNDYSTFDRLTQIRKEIQDIRGQNVPMIIVGNKNDVEDREVPLSIADSVACIDWRYSYHDVSAKCIDDACSVFNDVLNHYPALYGEKMARILKDEKKTEMRDSLQKHSKYHMFRSSLVSLKKYIHSH